MRLRDDQLWFAHAVMTGSGATEAAQRLTVGPRLAAVETLDIYRRGYEKRLVECLADDYPVLKHALGEEAFETLCREYIARFPSEGPSLNGFGRHMPAFVSGTHRAAGGGFAVDLAALEWAIVEAIHAAEGKPIDPARLATIPADAWPRVRLERSPSLTVLRGVYAVNEYFQSVRDGRDPGLPAARPSATAVYRRGLTVWRQDLSPVMADVLSALVRGGTLGESVASVPDDQPPERVLSWFREWMEAGLFVSVDVSGT
jgi:hypothetical protein